MPPASSSPKSNTASAAANSGNSLPAPEPEAKSQTKKTSKPENKDSPSPFLPGTKLQFCWDATSLSWLKACPRKYEYSMIRGLRSRGTTSAHLTFGIHYHAALELYDRLRAEGVDHEIAVKEVLLDLLQRTWEDGKCKTCGGAGKDVVEGNELTCADCGGDGAACGRSWKSDHHIKTRETLVRSVVWYLEEFGESDPIKTVILANGKPAVELTFKFDSGIAIDTTKLNYTGAPYTGGLDCPNATVTPTYILSGHLDRVGTLGSDPYIVDRKTSSTALSPSFFNQFNPHTQMTLYTIAGQIVYNIPIRGVIIDAAQVAVGFTRFNRSTTFRTQGQLEEYLYDLAKWLRLAESYAAEDHWPQNTEACHNYGGCPFRKICCLDPSHREAFIRNDYEVKPWNPLQER